MFLEVRIVVTSEITVTGSMKGYPWELVMFYFLIEVLVI